MNKVQLIGRVGNPFNRNDQSATGEFTNETTEWHIVKVLGESNCQRAEKHFTKGKPLYLEGSLKTEHWKNQVTWQDESKTKIYLNHWEFLPKTLPGNHKHNAIKFLTTENKNGDQFPCPISKIPISGHRKRVDWIDKAR